MHTWHWIETAYPLVIEIRDDNKYAIKGYPAGGYTLVDKEGNIVKRFKSFLEAESYIEEF